MYYVLYKIEKEVFRDCELYFTYFCTKEIFPLRLYSFSMYFQLIILHFLNILNSRVLFF